MIKPKKKPKKEPASNMAGKMLVGVSKTKPGLGGAGKKSAMKLGKPKKLSSY